MFNDLTEQKNLKFNILFKIDEKDLEKFVKSKGYDKENYLIYFKALKRNEKKLGKEHIKYILEYLKEKDKEEAQNFIVPVNMKCKKKIKVNANF